MYVIESGSIFGNFLNEAIPSSIIRHNRQQFSYLTQIKHGNKNRKVNAVLHN